MGKKPSTQQPSVDGANIPEALPCLKPVDLKLREPKFEKTLAQHLVRDPMFPEQKFWVSRCCCCTGLWKCSFGWCCGNISATKYNNWHWHGVCLLFFCFYYIVTGNITFQQRSGVPQYLIGVLLVLGWKRVGLVVRGLRPCFPCVFNVPMFNGVIVHHHDHVPQKLS